MCMEAAHNLLWCGHLVVCLWTQTIVGGRLFLLIVRGLFGALVSIIGGVEMFSSTMMRL